MELLQDKIELTMAIRYAAVLLLLALDCLNLAFLHWHLNII